MNIKQKNKSQEQKEVRILARHIARKLTKKEIKVISGGGCVFGSTPSNVRGYPDDNPGFICG